MSTKIAEVRQIIPEFIAKVEQARTETEIAQACQEIKNKVDAIWQTTEGRRDSRAMGAIKKAIEDRFPRTKVDSEVEANFPYQYSDSGKGRVKRLEHLAHKYLKDERNPKREEKKHEEKPVVDKVVKSEMNILDCVELSEDELKAVKEAIADVDVNEWIKQAIVQRANVLNALRQRFDEDLSMIASDELINDKKYRTNPVACRELTCRAVRAIKAFNANHSEHRWCLTNKLISEITGNTVKAISKAVEGMDIESYNQTMGLKPVNNRMTKAAIGDIKNVVSIEDVLGID